MNSDQLKKNQIYILFGIATLIGVFIVKDYITPVILGIFIAILTKPLFNMFLKSTVKLHWKNFVKLFYKTKTEVDGNRVIASFMTVITTLVTLSIFTILVLTLTGSSLRFIFNQPIDEGINAIISNPAVKENFGQYYEENDLKQRINNFLDQYKPSKLLTSQGQEIIKNNDSRVTLSRYLTSFANNLFYFLINFIIFMFSWIVMLISGKQLLAFMYKFSFFNKEEQEVINQDIVTAVRNVIIGNTVSGGIISLTVIAIGLYFKIPLLAVWAIFAFFIGFLPLSPSELAYLPVLIGIFFIHGIQPLIIVAIMIELFILILNNAVLPRITAGKETNPLLILISVFTAIATFGFAGFVIGPVLVYLLMALYKIANNRREAQLVI
jgi:predicted PurR-regulated permease PerM